jgi:hypothetical protein
MSRFRLCWIHRCIRGSLHRAQFVGKDAVDNQVTVVRIDFREADHGKRKTLMQEVFNILLALLDGLVPVSHILSAQLDFAQFRRRGTESGRLGSARR